MKEASLENSFSFISIRWDQTFDTISAPSMDTSSSYISSIYRNEKKNQLQHGSLYILYIEFDLEKKRRTFNSSCRFIREKSKSWPITIFSLLVIKLLSRTKRHLMHLMTRYQYVETHISHHGYIVALHRIEDATRYQITRIDQRSARASTISVASS